MCEKEKRVNCRGDIVLSKSMRVFISIVFRGQVVGLTEVDDKIWKVRFMDYDIGLFDEESCQLTPLENPMGEKMSTMLSV